MATRKCIKCKLTTHSLRRKRNRCFFCGGKTEVIGFEGGK